MTFICCQPIFLHIRWYEDFPPFQNWASPREHSRTGGRPRGARCLLRICRIAPGSGFLSTTQAWGMRLSAWDGKWSIGEGKAVVADSENFTCLPKCVWRCACPGNMLPGSNPLNDVIFVVVLKKTPEAEAKELRLRPTQSKYLTPPTSKRL